jgi:hypothetical protein
MQKEAFQAIASYYSAGACSEVFQARHYTKVNFTLKLLQTIPIAPVHQVLTEPQLETARKLLTEYFACLALGVVAGHIPRLNFKSPAIQVMLNRLKGQLNSERASNNLGGRLTKLD